MRVDSSADGLRGIDLMMCVIWLLFWNSTDALRLAQGVGELGTSYFDSAYILNNNRRQAIFFHSFLLDVLVSVTLLYAPCDTYHKAHNTIR
jgi:hypothetical protein